MTEEPSEGGPVNYRSITVGEICWVLIAIFVILAYFNGWGT